MLTLAACSKDEVVQQNPNDAISFTATTGKAVSRAADGYCNKQLPDQFDVWARVGTNNYFAKETYSNSGSGDTYSITGGVERYWPDATQTVEFYAALNYGGKNNVDPDWNEAAGTGVSPLTITGYQVEAEPGLQKDFIYAMTSASKPADGTGVTKINFRHALSQIEFKAKNQNPNIYVEISGVQLVNVFDRGNFAFPISKTETNIQGTGSGSIHTSLPSDQTITPQGKWTVTTDDGADPATLLNSTYTIVTKDMTTDPIDQNNAPVAVKGNDKSVSLTETDKTNAEYNSQTLYVMPYDFSAAGAIKPWDGTGKPEDAKNNSETTKGKRAYLALKCNIWNVAAGDGSVEKNILLWDGSDKYIAVLLDENTKWEQGKRYVYTFVFTKDGNGGIDPDGNEVLTPIKLQVTVDDFVDAGNTDVKMEK